jgi:hypothetical protein
MRRGVQLVFHSFHAAAASPEQIAAIGEAIGTKYRRLKPGVLVSDVDTGRDLYGSTAAWRQRAMTSTLYSGTLVSDSRSDDRSHP